MVSGPIYSRVVAATDFSEAAAHALARAAMLATEHGASLELVHVVQRVALEGLRWIASPEELGERLCRQARESLDALRASLAKPADITTHVEVGDVAEGITARATPDALVVVGAQGEGRLRDLLLGSIAERLVGRGERTVLVVKSAPAKPYGKVLAALDLQAGSRQVLEAALRIAPAATVTAAHAYDVPFESTLQRAGVGRSHIDHHRGEALRQALEQIDKMARAAAREAHRVLPFADRGHAASFLLERATAIDADLIVLGARPRNVAERLLVGSVARHVIAGAASDVLVAPQLAAARA